VKKNKSKEIKKLKKKLAEKEVLERVIKTRYETLSKNFERKQLIFGNISP
jgi:hypothetical protein